MAEVLESTGSRRVVLAHQLGNELASHDQPRFRLLARGNIVPGADGNHRGQQPA
jgi:hypothetical protein